MVTGALTFPAVVHRHWQLLQNAGTQLHVSNVMAGINDITFNDLINSVLKNHLLIVLKRERKRARGASTPRGLVGQRRAPETNDLMKMQVK